MNANGQKDDLERMSLKFILADIFDQMKAIRRELGELRVHAEQQSLAVQATFNIASRSKRNGERLRGVDERLRVLEEGRRPLSPAPPIASGDSGVHDLAQLEAAMKDLTRFRDKHERRSEFLYRHWWKFATALLLVFVTACTTVAISRFNPGGPVPRIERHP